MSNKSKFRFRRMFFIICVVSCLSITGCGKNSPMSSAPSSYEVVTYDSSQTSSGSSNNSDPLIDIGNYTIYDISAEDIKRDYIFAVTDDYTGVEYFVLWIPINGGSVAALTPRYNADGTLYIDPEYARTHSVENNSEDSGYVTEP